MLPQPASATSIPSANDCIDIARIIDAAPMSRFQRLVVFLTAFSIVIDGIDSQLLGIAIPVMMTEWAVSRGAFAPVLAAGFVGMMVGGAIAGVVGDRLGRRVALIGSVLTFGVMTVSASFVHGLIALAMFRFFVGIGLQGASPNAAALVSEYAPLRNRAFAITLTIVCVPAGAMVAGLLAIPILPVLGWRVLFAIGGLIPLIVGILLLRFLPESPRYLVQQRARWPELSRILRRIDPGFTANASFVDSAELATPRAPLMTLFAPGLSLDTCALWSAFFFCLLAVYSGFNWLPSMLTQAGLSSLANTGITAYNLGGVIGAVVGALAIKRYGSRSTMVVVAALASATALAMRSMTFSATAPTTSILVMLATIGSLINAVQVTMYAVGAHIYPTIARSTGVGVASSVGRVGAILSTYAGAWALETGGSSAFFTLVAAAMLAVTLSLALIRRHIPGTTPFTAAALSTAN